MQNAMSSIDWSSSCSPSGRSARRPASWAMVTVPVEAYTRPIAARKISELSRLTTM
jgi:hypothetical protein